MTLKSVDTSGPWPLIFLIMLAIIAGATASIELATEPNPTQRINVYAVPGSDCEDKPSAVTEESLRQLKLPVLADCVQLPLGWTYGQLCQPGIKAILIIGREFEGRGGMGAFRQPAGGSCIVIRINPSKGNSFTWWHELTHLRLGHGALVFRNRVARFITNLFLDVFVTDAYILFGPDRWAMGLVDPTRVGIRYRDSVGGS